MKRLVWHVVLVWRRTAYLLRSLRCFLSIIAIVLCVDTPSVYYTVNFVIMDNEKYPVYSISINSEFHIRNRLSHTRRETLTVMTEWSLPQNIYVQFWWRKRWKFYCWSMINLYSSGLLRHKQAKWAVCFTKWTDGCDGIYILPSYKKGIWAIFFFLTGSFATSCLK